ncbi:MAG: toprim domain-containing protein, partial [Proteobacteria bacterium]|nr:toprim domain-containing protein [Pseudomonadota bacterium]
KTQAILPIRGKILNVERARMDRMLASVEIQAIIAALGGGIGSDFDVTKLRYHKIIIMTDADVDGSHIRTLLLTFFYRQMRQLVDEGYLYIAQAPLFKLKRGKSERYIKDEPELEAHLLDLALANVRVAAAGSPAPLEQSALRQLLGCASEQRRLLDRMAMRQVDARVVAAAAWAGAPSEGDLADAERLIAEVAERVAGEFALRDPEGETPVWSTEPDQEHAAHRLLAETRRAGLVFRTRLDTALLRSGEFQRLGRLIEQMRDVGQPPYELRAGDDADAEAEAIHTPTALLARVLELGGKGLSIQRYKGLGEMNPDQLADTTMNPELRTLLQVRVEDAVEADLVFTTLMGDEVEPRRQFIENNALNVQNLDI